MKKISASLAAAVALSLPFAALAEWPEKQITMVVPAAPGGTTDIAARLLGEKMSKLLGQNVIVENKAGAGGIIGTGHVARATPDGYTILMSNIGPAAINYSLYKKLPYKHTDFTPITNVILVPNVLVVHADSDVKSVDDLKKKAAKGPLTVATSGIGQSPHMSSEMFKQRTGIDATLVPHSGAAPAVTAMLGQQMDYMIDNLPSSMPHIQSGKFRALAVTSGKRVDELPDVPTMAEAGVENMEVTAWFGLLAPAGTPQPVIDKLYQAAKASLETDEVKARFKALGGTAGGETPAEYAAFIDKERATWKEIVETAGISLE